METRNNVNTINGSKFLYYLVKSIIIFMCSFVLLSTFFVVFSAKYKVPYMFFMYFVVTMLTGFYYQIFMIDDVINFFIKKPKK